MKDLKEKLLEDTNRLKLSIKAIERLIKILKKPNLKAEENDFLTQDITNELDLVNLNTEYLNKDIKALIEGEDNV